MTKCSRSTQPFPFVRFCSVPGVNTPENRRGRPFSSELHRKVPLDRGGSEMNFAKYVSQYRSPAWIFQECLDFSIAPYLETLFAKWHLFSFATITREPFIWKKPYRSHVASKWVAPLVPRGFSQGGTHWLGKLDSLGLSMHKGLLLPAVTPAQP